MESTVSPNGVDNEAATSPDLRYITWGIFKIAYVPSTKYSSGQLWSFVPTFSAMREYRKSAKVLHRLASDVWHMSQWHCIVYLMYEMATVTSPAAALFSAYQVHCNLHAIAAGISPHDTSMKLRAAQIWAIIWIVWGNLSNMRYKPLLRFRGHIGGHMRCRYMPELVKAQLLAPEERPKPRMLIGVESFGEYIPVWSAVDELSTHICRSLEIIFEVLVVIHIAWQMEHFQGTLLIASLLLLMISFIYVPTNLVGGAGYTFWTENELYKSLMRTHAVVFDGRHRPTTIRDGIIENICQEYEEKLRTLGPVQADTWILSMGLTPRWYWELLAGFVSNSPMALYVLAYLLPGRGIPATSLITSMALVQYITYAMSSSFQAAKGMGQIKTPEELVRICDDLASFYEFLDFGSLSWKRPLPEKDAMTKGASLALCVTASGMVAVTNATPCPKTITATSTFDMTINAGEVVGIIINNKDERQIFGEIICGLRPVINGSITWDDIPLTESNVTWPRQEMAYATPGDTVYPLSLKNNIMMGLDESQKRLVTDLNLDSAARLCELSPIVDTYGWDYIPDGATIAGNSVMPQPDLEAWRALNMHYPPPGISKLTEAQRFAIILCRVYLRVRHGSARLIFLEKPEDRPLTCPALEALCKLARDEGKTLMVVASETNMPPLDSDRVKLDKVIRA